MKYFLSKMVVIRPAFSVMLETLCWHVEEVTFLLGFVNLPRLAAGPPGRPLLLTSPPPGSPALTSVSVAASSGPCRVSAPGTAALPSLYPVLCCPRPAPAMGWRPRGGLAL